MTNEELIRRLRHYAQIAHAAAAWGFAGEGEVMSRAADRIEQLAATNEALVKERDRAWQEADAWSGKYGWAVRDKEAEEARAERLEDALKRARDFIERGGRDRIGPVLRQIDAALKGDQK